MGILSETVEFWNETVKGLLLTKGSFHVSEKSFWKKVPVRERPKDKRSRVGTQSNRREDSSEIDKVRGVSIRLMGIIDSYVMGSRFIVRNSNQWWNLRF